MKLSLSHSHDSRSLSFFRREFGSSLEKTLNPLLEAPRSRRSSAGKFPVNNLRKGESPIGFGFQNQGKNCLKKHEKVELELKRLPEERVEDESMLAFRGQLNLGCPPSAEAPNKTKDSAIQTGAQMLGAEKNLELAHLKQIDFDEEALRKQDEAQKDLQFERFFKNVSTKSSLSQARDSTQYNFESMNLKLRRGFNAPARKPGLEGNFGFQIFKHLKKERAPGAQPSLSQAISREPHVCLKKMGEKPASFKETFSEFLRKRRQNLPSQGSLVQARDKKSLQSTGLRRKNAVFGGAGDASAEPLEQFKLISILNQTPELRRKKTIFLGPFPLKSLRRIPAEALRTPEKRHARPCRTSIRKKRRVRVSGKGLKEFFRTLGTPDLSKRNFGLFSDASHELLSQFRAEKTLEESLDRGAFDTPKKAPASNAANSKLRRLLSSAPKKKKKRGCKCKKTKCTRLHCICFRERGFCGEQCGCTGCLNREEYSDTIQKIKAFTKEINPLAFAPKIETIDLEGGRRIHNRGCSCAKNRCRKNYCECFKHGLSCSPLCKCEGCRNEKVDLDVGKIREVFKRCSRKKKKFVIFLDKEKPSVQKIHI